MAENIRRATIGDMPVLLALSKSSPHPWTEGHVGGYINGTNSHLDVIVKSGVVCGMAAYELYPDRVHLINLIVDQRHRRKGLGRKLVDNLKLKLRAGGRCCITAEVRERLLDMQMFLRGEGFKAINTIAGYFVDSGEDAYLMRYML